MLFEYLKKYKKIIVVGPHRSGTTFTAMAIAKDTKHTFLDEKVIKDVRVRKIDSLHGNYGDFVLQAPYAISWIPVLTDKDTCFVLVKRNVDDIEKSVKTSKRANGVKISEPGFSPEQAYNIWECVKDFAYHYIEVYYEDLWLHPDYVSKENRKNWHHKQIDKSGRNYKEKING